MSVIVVKFIAFEFKWIQFQKKKQGRGWVGWIDISRCLIQFFRPFVYLNKIATFWQKKNNMQLPDLWHQN